jgi:CRP-like cAMP-binding protein
LRALCAGERLFGQDEPATDAFAVPKGRIAVLHRETEGRETMVEAFGRRP